MADGARYENPLSALVEKGLYAPASERDNCGVGFVAHIDGHRSHRIIDDALHVLGGLTHRGGIGSDPDTGDGCGILLQIPHVFLRDHGGLSFSLSEPGQYALGQLLLPATRQPREAAVALIADSFRNSGLEVLGWRAVPTDHEYCGKLARATAPFVSQVFISRPASCKSTDDFERQLYVARRRTEQLLRVHTDPARSYFCSLSSRTVVYKGLLLPRQLARFYTDLAHPALETAMAIVHQRFSTNTFPSWERAHPYRMVAHNGEINTLNGNRAWMRARETALKDERFTCDLHELSPIANPDGSDSATFDNVLELLWLGGRSLVHSMMMMVPEAWEANPLMAPQRRAFYEYHASLMEPWDGPALVTFCDGVRIGASLDRNGLRPGRYAVTHDNRIVMSSEAGVLPMAPEQILELGRLQPGRMLLIDTDRGAIIDDDELKAGVTGQSPYQRWVDDHLLRFEPVPPPHSTGAPCLTGTALRAAQRAHGYTREDLHTVLAPMAAQAAEPIGAMGDDAALAVLNERPQPLFNYFKQLFAQVTNPPIDAIRESTVMSLRMLLGGRANLLSESPQACRQLELGSPVLTNEAIARLRVLDADELSAVTLDTLFSQHTGLETALCKLVDHARATVRAGAKILLLSDRNASATQLPIPSLLAVSAVHHGLIDTGLRNDCALVAESGDAREVMHFCLLIGYGASAVNPYLAFDSLQDLCQTGSTEVTEREALRNYVKAIDKGILKVLSKMGISTLSAYHGAQIFEAIGLGRQLVADYFPGTVSRLDGIGLEVIEQESVLRHEAAWRLDSGVEPDLEWGNRYKWRRDGERHQLTPNVVGLLQHAVRSADYGVFKKYTRLVDRQNTRACELRGLLQFTKVAPIALEQVESAAEIVKRFRTGAMSFGSLSKEVHETLAIAMNRLGGRSNSGEGGEDPKRYSPDENGERRNSAIKQIASGRFGVTPEYVLSAAELQIKMAQGAKPGEGGHLPGDKVDGDIARVRHSTPGVDLISPPPHHDIYSIEDLAQLIYDLNHANADAEVSVKLVSEVGVGTIAAGVAKANADRIVISGHSGGTGASPLSSIKHAGLPWELGLAETQQVLMANNLRGRVELETDGQLKTGRDVVIAAMLGAESFSFGTAALIASGCILMRVCHMNTCPVGVATQDPVLRQRFTGLPDHVMNFMLFIAEEVREILASLGVTSLDELIGNTDFLTPRDDVEEHWKARYLDLSRLLHRAELPATSPRQRTLAASRDLTDCLDHQILQRTAPAFEAGRPVTISVPITNQNRSVGTLLSSKITRRFGSRGLPPHTVRVELEGAAGQSLGGFLAPGVDLCLSGVANDAVGKSMAGGRIVVRSRGNLPRPDGNMRIGNVALYGATAGKLFVEGSAGERFAVRNSGASAVVEGIGDHGCEYMTGGTVLILGPTGKNFGAGMSGGCAYVLDTDGRFSTRCNTGMVDIEPLDSTDTAQVRALLRDHYRLTESPKAWEITTHWGRYAQQLIKVVPRCETRVQSGAERGMREPPQRRAEQ